MANDIHSSSPNLIISLDIWDTLLRRDIAPDAIKIFSEQRYQLLSGNEYLLDSEKLLQLRFMREKKLAEDSQVAGFDDEFNIFDVYASASMTTNKDSHDHVQFEVDLELSHTFKDPEIEEFIAKFAQDKTHQIYAISDFYMGQEQLNSLLQSKLPNLQIVSIYSSADYRLNKRGGLFPHLRGINPFDEASDWIHVGYNIYSDVSKPRTLGIQALHYLPSTPENQRQLNERKWLQRQNSFMDYLKRQHGLERYSAFGFALSLVGYTQALRAEAIQRNARILFLEREGATLHSIYAKASEKNIWNLPDVDCKTIPVSRSSLIAACLHQDFSAAFSIMTYHYRNMTGQDFLGSIGYVGDQSWINKNQQIDIFLGNNKNIEAIRKFCFQRFKLTINALAPYLMDHENFICSDVGWSGSMQAMLQLLFPESNFFGFYLATSVKDTLLQNSKKKSFLSLEVDSSALSTILLNKRPIEMLFTPPLGSVTGYETNGEPLRDASWSPKESPVEFCKFAELILMEIESASDFIVRNCLILNELQKIGIYQLSDFLTNPGTKIVKSYLASSHDETFGVNKKIDLSEKVSVISRIRILNPLSFRFRSKIWVQSGWEFSFWYSLFGFYWPARQFMKLNSILETKVILQNIENLAKKFSQILRILQIVGIKRTWKMRGKGIRYLKQYGIRSFIGRTLSTLRFFSASTGAPLQNSKIFVPKSMLSGVVFSGLSRKNGIQLESLQTFLDGENAFFIERDVFLQNLALFKHAALVVLDQSFTFTEIALIKNVLQRVQIREISDFKSKIRSEVNNYSKKLVLRNRLRMAWIIPTLPIASGGHRGMIRMAISLAEFGIIPTFYIINDSSDSDELFERLNNHYYESNFEVKVGYPEFFEEDFVVATAHYTLADAILRTSRYESRVYYFVQDDEALFNPISSEFFFARGTFYDERAEIIASGSWMSNRVKELSGRHVFSFPFPVNKSIYYPGARRNQINQNLVFYYKPEASRRLAEFGVAVLEIVQSILPEITIHTFGSATPPPETLRVNNFGQLETIDEIAELYRKSRVGLIFSPTNPSLIPYEMAACGLPVVDFLESQDQAKRMFTEETAILIAEPSVQSVARMLVKVLTDDNFWNERRELCLEVSNSFPTAEGVAKLVADYIKTN